MSGAAAPIALVFPGQGSQSPGMLGALAARYPVVQRCFAEASAALGFDLWRLTAEGPAERLDTTDPHRLFGPLNCRGWYRLHGVHLEDHVHQIAKIKAMDGYPIA